MSQKLRGMFGKNKDKKTQKLGIDIIKVVNKFMTTEAKGFVDKSEFNYFWLAMRDDSPEVDVYIHLLVQHLLGFIRKNNSHRIPFNAQVLLNTINFLVLRHPTQSPSKQVKEILNKWNKNRVKYDDQTLPAAKDVLGVLYKQRVEEKNGLDSLIIQCYQFYSHEELARISDYYENPTIIHVVDGIHNIGRSSGDKVCIWPYLTYLASRDPDNFRLIIQNTIKKLRGISGLILLHPKLAEISLLALIFMMRQLISYTRVPDEQWLQKSISNLKRFYLWPIPYGSQARDLLIKLQKERVAPGYALIQKIWRECRLPEIVLSREHAYNKTAVSTLSASSASASGSASDDSDEYESSFRPLYYLFDVDDAKALLFANVMKIDAQTDWGINYKVHSGPSAYISGILILNIISYDCGRDNPELESAIRKLNSNEIQIFYKQVIEIFTSSSANVSDSVIAKQSRCLGLKEISAQIVAHANEKDGDGDLDDDEEREECILYNEDLARIKAADYRVDLPALHHTGIGCDLKKKEFPSPGQMASAEMLYPANQVLLKLTSLLSNLHDLIDEDNDDIITLRFMIAGGNHILSATATAYASLVRHADTLLSNFNIEFFIFPISKNHYSEWLARQDPWYNRHIYLPLSNKLFVAPSLLPDTKSRLRSHGHLHTVGQFYREMSENYAREADQLVKLRLWECLCWESPPYTKTPHQLIPFCLRVEIGKKVDKKGQNEMYNNSNYNYRTRTNTNMHNSQQAGNRYGSVDIIEEHIDYKNGYEDDFEMESQQHSVAMEAEDSKVESGGHGGFGSRSGVHVQQQQQQMEDGKMNMDEDDIDFDTFDYQAIGLDIEWQPVDMLGRAQIQTIEQKAQYIDALSLSSVPRYGDKGFPASPDKAGVIHLYCNSKLTNKKKKFQEYTLLKTEPSQHVRSCTIAANRQTDKLFVMVDDQIYGKFSRIKIQPMIEPISKDQVYMPIRTFFPVNV